MTVKESSKFPAKMLYYSFNYEKKIIENKADINL